MSGAGPSTEAPHPDERPPDIGTPPHLLVTEELVERALRAYEGADGPPFARMRDALSAVAPILYSAGFAGGRRTRDLAP